MQGVHTILNLSLRPAVKKYLCGPGQVRTGSISKLTGFRCLCL